MDMKQMLYMKIPISMFVTQNIFCKKTCFFFTHFIYDKNIIPIGASIHKIQFKFLIRNHIQRRNNIKDSNLEICSRSYALKFFTQLFDFEHKKMKRHRPKILWNTKQCKCDFSFDKKINDLKTNKKQQQNYKKREEEREKKK